MERIRDDYAEARLDIPLRIEHDWGNLVPDTHLALPGLGFLVGVGRCRVREEYACHHRD